MESTHVLIYLALISCLLKPKNFFLAIALLSVHMFFVDSISSDYIINGVKLKPDEWLFVLSMFSLLLASVSYLLKNSVIAVIFFVDFLIMSYIYITEPALAGHYLWHGYLSFNYKNFPIDLGYWIGVSVYLVMIVENARSYFTGSLSFVDHISYSHRQLFTNIKNFSILFYKENKKLFYDEIFRKG